VYPDFRSATAPIAASAVSSVLADDAGRGGEEPGHLQRPVGQRMPGTDQGRRGRHDGPQVARVDRGEPAADRQLVAERGGHLRGGRGAADEAQQGDVEDRPPLVGTEAGPVTERKRDPAGPQRLLLRQALGEVGRRGDGRHQVGGTYRLVHAGHPTAMIDIFAPDAAPARVRRTLTFRRRS